MKRKLLFNCNNLCYFPNFLIQFFFLVFRYVCVVHSPQIFDCNRTVLYSSNSMYISVSIHFLVSIIMYLFAAMPAYEVEE